MADFGDLFAIAQPGDGVVVEVRSAGSHGADGEGVSVGVAAGRSCGVAGVVVKLDGDGATRSSSASVRPADLAPSRRGSRNTLGGFGDEEVSQPAVGDFASEAQVLWAHCGDVDRHRPGAPGGCRAVPLLFGRGRG